MSYNLQGLMMALFCAFFQAFVESSKLKRHQLVHTGEKPFQVKGLWLAIIGATADELPNGLTQYFAVFYGIYCVMIRQHSFFYV